MQPLPYMSDEAMAAAGCRKGDYSARAYLQVGSACWMQAGCRCWVGLWTVAGVRKVWRWLW